MCISLVVEQCAAHRSSPRIDAVSTFLRGVVGDELAGAMQKMIVTEKIFEELAIRFSSQSAGHFTQIGRDHPEHNGRVSEEQYAAFTPAQKLDYSRSFDQRQFNREAIGR